MKRLTFEQLIEVVDGDREFVSLLISEGIVVESDEGFSARDVDAALASRTLVRELEVNWPGVEIILRLRTELAEARQRIEALEGRPAVTGESRDD